MALRKWVARSRQALLLWTLVALAFIALFLWTFRSIDTGHFQFRVRGNHSIGLMIQSGRVWCHVITVDRTPSGRASGHTSYVSEAFEGPLVTQWRNENGVWGRIHVSEITFSLLTAMAFLLVWPAVWLVGISHRVRTPETTAESPSITETTAPPDWENQSERIECPMCGYDLRGLTDPRCPECGYSFKWPELLDPKWRENPNLFEHARRGQSRAFFKTITRNFKPNRFWTTLHPTQPLNDARLFLYYLICGLVAASPAIASLWILIKPYPLFGWRASGRLEYVGQVLGNHATSISHLSLMAALYPAATALSLLVFQQSMRRAKVKRGHVLRCALYSADAIVWNALWQWAVILLLSLTGEDDWQLESLFLVGMILTIVLTTARLTSAYRNYMRFPHALATVIASQLVSVLSIILIDVDLITDIFVH